MGPYHWLDPDIEAWVTVNLPFVVLIGRMHEALPNEQRNGHGLLGLLTQI